MFFGEEKNYHGMLFVVDFLLSLTLSALDIQEVLQKTAKFFYSNYTKKEEYLQYIRSFLKYISKNHQNKTHAQNVLFLEIFLVKYLSQ